jgi:hypothetical protein
VSNSQNARRRQVVAMATAACFSVAWAALQWPWHRHADDARGSQWGAWLFIAYFLVLSLSLLRLPRLGRWLALATGAALLFFIGMVLPAAVGFTQLTCTGAGWRCYVEAALVISTGALLVATCIRPMPSAAGQNGDA